MVYQRFVAYIYEYQDNVKGKNKGYVKVEVKNGHCYMNYYLKDIGEDSGALDIYGFFREESGITGILLEKAPINGNYLEFAMDLDPNNLGGLKYRLEQISGILLMSNYSQYGTQWDDKTISLEGFKVIESEKENQESKTVSMEDNLKENVIPEKNIEKEEEVKEEEKVLEGNELESQEVKEEEAKKRQLFTCVYQEDKNKMKERWKELIGEFPPLKPFEDGGFVECIKITPSDLTRLQRQDWVLGNNSFLLHGYYNYNYLILGKVEAKDCYILGVPGIFDHQERFMATMFGFPNFKPEKESKLKMGQFGYWYRPIY